MAAAKEAPKPDIGYYLPEEALWKLEWIRDSLKLLQYCADESRDNGKIELDLLGSHLSILTDYLNSAIDAAEFPGARGDV